MQLVDLSAPAEHPLDGHSLRRLLLGHPDVDRPETFLMHYPHAPHRSDYWSSYREGAWKVIYHYFPTAVSENSPYQLFHLSADPWEQNNLAQSEPEQQHRMMERLIAALEAHQALYSVEEDQQTARRPRLP